MNKERKVDLHLPIKERKVHNKADLRLPMFQVFATRSSPCKQVVYHKGKMIFMSICQTNRSKRVCPVYKKNSKYICLVVSISKLFAFLHQNIIYLCNIDLAISTRRRFI